MRKKTKKKQKTATGGSSSSDGLSDKSEIELYETIKSANEVARIHAEAKLLKQQNEQKRLDLEILVLRNAEKK